MTEAESKALVELLDEAMRFGHPLKCNEAYIKLRSALSAQPVQPSDPECWEQGKPDSIDRAMAEDLEDAAKLYAQANALGVAAIVSGNQEQAAEARALHARARAIEAMAAQQSKKP